jgi:hypothetical protein
MRSNGMRCIVILVLVAFVPADAARLFAADPTAKEVLDAIAAGRDYLVSQQLDGGRWLAEVGGRYPDGVTALVLLALMNSGMTPADEPVRKGLEYLRSLPATAPGSTYEISLVISALVAANAGERDKAQILRMVHQLEATQLTKGVADGAWSYPLPSEELFDHSNSQFAILGLREAAVFGVPVRRETWVRARRHWIATQGFDGGWNYTGEARPSSGSMTAAGIATLVITESMLGESKDLDEAGNLDCCGESADDDALEKGLRWMERNFTAGRNPGDQRWLLYYLYGVERAGRLSGKRFFGRHDWYREGAAFLVKGQNVRTGFWRETEVGGSDRDPIVGTSFALLFLSKGLAPVLINKLKFGPAHDRGEITDENWNKHPKDIRNLVEHISGLDKWPKLLNWQVVDAAKLGPDGVRELQQAPVLFLSGLDAPLLPNEQNVQQIREYLNQGGFIFAVSNCNGTGFEDGFRELVARLFPEGEAQLRRLPPEHPVFRSEYPLDREPPELYGVDFGCRTAIIFAKDDWSCLWEKAARVDPPKRQDWVKQRILKSLKVGLNVVAYATGRELLDNKLDQSEKHNREEKDYEIERGLLEVAKLRHTGADNAAPQAVRNLMDALNEKTGPTASTKVKIIPATDPTLFNYAVVYMHGKNRFQLSKLEIDNLRKYLDQGGVLIADSCCGSKPFDTSFRDLVEQLYSDKKLERVPPDHEMFTEAVGFDIRRVKRRVFEADQPGQPLVTQIREGEPLIEGVKVGERYSILYSPYDISCALEQQGSLACAGYIGEDAVKIGVNLMRYALLQDLSLAEAPK